MANNFKFGRGFVDREMEILFTFDSQHLNQLIDEQQRLIQMRERRNRFLNAVQGGEAMANISNITLPIVRNRHFS